MKNSYIQNQGPSSVKHHFRSQSSPCSLLLYPIPQLMTVPGHCASMWPAMAAMWQVDLSQVNKSRKHLAEHKDRATAKYSGICGSSCNILLPVSFYSPKM